MSQPPRKPGSRRGPPRDAPPASRGPFPRPPAPRAKRPSTAAPNAAKPAGPSLRAEGQEGERIAKLLARAGVASRREVERMIVEGRIKIGDEVVTTPATLLKDLRGVSVDGTPVKAAEATRLFAFHKPPGLITAERDPAGRPTIYTALRNALPPGAGRLMPVGRLDFNTEGLLLLTNDGEFKRLLELPATRIPRTYRARAFGPITQAQLEELIEGIEIEGMKYGRIDANMERSSGRNQWIQMSITEGKNREIRRVLEHFGLEVSRLIRVGYGPFALDDLRAGHAVEIPAKQIDMFRKSLNIKTSEKPA
jgi:23S rRNA pseudouridine2605 synthase